MIEEIILAQNTTSTPVTTEVIDNLRDSEVELNQLNQQFDNLREEYKAVVNNLDNPSFFNFDNVYFWFVIVGLLLLVFGLWWWLLELKKESKVKRVEVETTPEVKEEVVILEPVKKTKTNKKVIKVKVRKVKKA